MIKTFKGSVGWQAIKTTVLQAMNTRMDYHNGPKAQKPFINGWSTDNYLVQLTGILRPLNKETVFVEQLVQVHKRLMTGPEGCAGMPITCSTPKTTK